MIEPTTKETHRWEKPLAITTPGAAYWPVVWAMQKHPFFSVFSEKAIKGMAEAMVDALPVKEEVSE